MATYDRKKYSLRKVRLNAGGYDENGTYYGVNSPGKILYFAENLEDNYGRHLRARDRKDAIRQMQQMIVNGDLEDDGKIWPLGRPLKRLFGR